MGEVATEEGLQPTRIEGVHTFKGSKSVPRAPMVGSEVELELQFRARQMACKAVVRRLLTKNGSQGIRLVLGLQFAFIDSVSSDVLDRMIGEAAEEFELAREF